MNYDSIMELDNLTLEDCVNIYKLENIYTIVNDGKLAGLRKEKGEEMI